MKIYVTSIFVDDQAKALDFYTSKLGFEKKTDIPLGEYRWLTVVAPNQPNGVELLLEPSAHRAVPPFKQASKRDGIPFASFEVDNIEDEFSRLQSLNVEFTQEPTPAGEVITAVIDDTCGNLIQIIQRVA
ncbi:MAG: VOC family protein [Leptolyngbyaceae cyanobacterium MO_188.B28]|nr:VOC family protein [Leptolyngbyaceae cyanobacterium MO_188.B28]